MEKAKPLIVALVLLAGLVAWGVIIYNPDTYAPPRRVQPIQVVP